MAPTIGNLEQMLRKKNYTGFSVLLKSLNKYEFAAARNFITAYFGRSKSMGADEFWHFAAIISESNWLLFRDVVVESKIRRSLFIPSSSNRRYFKELLRAFADNDNDIRDIHVLLSKYSEFIDRGCLAILSHRTKEFLWPDGYSILCDGANLTFSEYKKLLLKDRTICSLYEFARTLISATFGNENGKPKKLPVSRILKHANDLGNTPVERMTKDALMVYCNHDMESEACDLLCNDDFKGYKAYYNTNYRGNKFNNDQKKSSNTTRKESSVEPNNSASETIDFSTVEIKDIPLKLIAYKEGRMAFTEPFDNYNGGILFPQNVTLRKQPLPYDIACNQIQVIFGSGQKTGYYVVNTVSIQNVCYAILGLDFEQLSDKKNLDLFRGLHAGGTYPVEIMSSGQHFKKVGILLSNFYGYISNEDYKKSMVGDDENMVVPIAALPQNECQPILFGSELQHHIKIDREAEMQLRERYKNLFNNLELQCIKAEDRRLIDLMLSEYPSFGSDAKRLDVIEEQDILCRYENSSLDSAEQMRNLQTILDSSNFWVFPRNYNGTDYLTVFNQKSIVIEIEVRGFGFHLTGAYDATVDATAQKKLEYAKNTNLKIRGSKIRLYGTYDTIPTDYNATWTFNYIQRLSYYFKIKNDLSKRVFASLENTARDFKNQQLYLDYQIDKEIKKKKNPLHFPPQKLRPVSGDWQDEAISLKIDMSATEYLYLMGYTDDDDETLEDEIGVNTIVDYKVKDRCRLTINADGEYILKFIGSHKNCAEYQETGIDLQSDANIEHLKMQSAAIKQFTRDADSLFRDLIGNSISVPEWHKYDGIKFFNEQFYNVEEGNNQPEAVKKALSLEKKGVLLIQGPPGTGKTTTIVEIIRQLISQKRRVLVCSQSHAAVGNIYDKLVSFCDNILRVDIDEHNTSNARNFNSEDYKKFLANNQTLLSRLREKKAGEVIDESLYSDFNYSNEIIQKQYQQLHNRIAHYYLDNKELDNPTLTSMLCYLEEEAQNISGSMLETQIYQSKDAILGTCIGVGMNYILKNNTVHFDTVIIDEAAKANLAETIVPIRMGDRYILVGDDNQLPPYVDQGDIEELISSNRYNPEKKLSFNEMVSSQNKSLFEYLHYHRDPLFPEECLVTLNYQYRMNPEIGDFISNLFYGGKILNGYGTDKQDVFVPGFPNPVTIIDTSGQKDNHESSVSGSTSHRNVCEARFICDEILPKLSTVMMNNAGITVGIISPYSSQCDYIRSLIGDQKLRKAVHTIDSIQGMEFDIVVFSFVRSFKSGSKAKVGFVDDMKRLNVSLSRAKKKLIVIGDMQTLTNPAVHYEVETEGIRPLDVFRKLADLPTKISISKTSIEHFLSSGIEAGEVLLQCSWNYGHANSTILVSFEYKGRQYHFQMKVSSTFKMENKTSDKIDLKYLGPGRDSKPYFGFATLADETRYGYFNLLAKCVDAKDFPSVKFEINDEQFEVEMSNLRSLRLSMQKGIIYHIKRERSDYVEVDANKQFELFKSHHKEGDFVEGVITGSKEMLRCTPSRTLYFVNVEGYPCGCITRSELEEGSTHTFSLYQYDYEKKQITLSYNFRYDR